MAGVLTPAGCISQVPCHLAPGCALLLGDTDARLEDGRRQGCHSLCWTISPAMVVFISLTPAPTK